MALPPFAETGHSGTLDEELYLVQELDGLHKALRIHTPPEDLGPPAEEEGESLQELRNRSVLLHHASSSKGLNDAIGDGFLALNEVIDSYLDIMPKRRDLLKEKGIALRQMYQELSANNQTQLKGKELSVAEGITEFSWFLA
jgi:hypothetical protein